MSDWHLINQFIFIAVLLFIAKFLNEKTPVLKKYIIPTALVAGFLGWLFIFAQDITGVQLFQLNSGFLGEVIYHSMAIGFIAMTLKHKENAINRNTWITGGVIVMTYLLQGIIGFSVVWAIFKFGKDIFPGAGLLLPLGFGQGPGYAYSIGTSWEPYLLNGGNLGVTIATIGFLWGGIFGVIVLNFYARKHNLKVLTDRFENKLVQEQYTFETANQLRFSDALTVQIVMILVVYAFVGITIGATGKYLPMIGGGIGSTLAGLFHGFHFMFGIFYSLIFKKIQNNLEARGHRSKFVTNNYILSNITSFMFNIMIAASFIIITIETVGMYWLELLIITSVGGVLSYFFLKFVVAKLYGHSIFEYLIALYGMLTGTASTGIALLKSVDPDLKTEVAENLVAGSATAAIFGIPLILIILPLPVVGWTTNQPIYYSITLIALIGYLIILFFGFLWFSRRKTA